MTVTYTEKNDSVYFRVPSNIDTGAKLISYIIAAWKKPPALIALIVDDWLLSGVIRGSLRRLYFDKLNVAAYTRHIKYWGEDNYDSWRTFSGTVEGTSYEVITQSSKYFRKQYTEKIFLDPDWWGEGRISHILAPSVYNAFYSTLRYVSEGR